MRTSPGLARPQKTRYRFALEISAVVLLKAALLGWAWHTWFSHPLAGHMQMSPALVQQQLLGAQPAPASYATGDNHDPRR